MELLQPLITIADIRFSAARLDPTTGTADTVATAHSRVPSGRHQLPVDLREIRVGSGRLYAFGLMF
jgi:hypothetical protein